MQQAVSGLTTSSTRSKDNLSSIWKQMGSALLQLLAHVCHLVNELRSILVACQNVGFRVRGHYGCSRKRLQTVEDVLYLVLKDREVNLHASKLSLKLFKHTAKVVVGKH